MSFEAFLDAAWNDHGDDPQAVARRIPEGAALVTTPAHLAALARLTTHVYGEHLARWEDGAAALASLRASPACDAAAAGAIDRGVATLRHAGGARDALEGLSTEDRVAVLAGVAAAYCGQGRHGDALACYAEADGAAPASLAASSPAARALAVAGNNLAAALEEKAQRTPAEAQGMVHAAQRALHYWTLAGTWLERERALYRLSCSLRCAGRVQEAAQRARECLAVCEAHDAPPFERFFACAALARAQAAGGDARAALEALAAAHAAYAGVAPDERRWCDAEMADLDAALVAAGDA